MMKWIPGVFVLVFAVTLFSACKKDAEGAVEIVFVGEFGDEPLVMFEYHDYSGPYRIQFTRSEFFMSNLRLLGGAGDHVLSDIELVDLSALNSGAAENGVLYRFNRVPSGTYSGIGFGFGVEPSINTTRPADYPSSSPLAATGRYWAPWNSYIFSKTEGNLDTLADGEDRPDLGFAFHTGGDAMYVSLTAAAPLTVNDNGTLRVEFYLDHARLLGLPGAPIDIKSNPQNHNPEDTVQVRQIIENLSQSLTFIVR